MVAVAKGLLGLHLGLCVSLSIVFVLIGFEFGLGLGGPLLGLCVCSFFLLHPPSLRTRSIESSYRVLVLSSDSSCPQKCKRQKTR